MKQFLFLLLALFLTSTTLAQGDNKLRFGIDIDRTHNGYFYKNIGISGVLKWGHHRVTIGSFRHGFEKMQVDGGEFHYFGSQFQYEYSPIKNFIIQPFGTLGMRTMTSFGAGDVRETWIDGTPYNASTKYSGMTLLPTIGFGARVQPLKGLYISLDLNLVGIMWWERFKWFEGETDTLIKEYKDFRSLHFPLTTKSTMGYGPARKLMTSLRISYIFGDQRLRWRRK